MTLLCTNYCKNPSFEVNVTDDWVLGGAGGGGSVARDDTYSKVGTYSCKFTAGDGNKKLEQAATTGGVAVLNGATVSISGWVRCAADPTGGKARLAASVAGTAVYLDLLATAASDEEWEYLYGSWTNTTGSTKQIAFACRNLFNDETTDVWFDACQLELAAAATTYTDGSLGGQCAWTGDAHNSTSTRTLATQAAAGAQTNTGNAAKRITLQSLQSLSGAISFSGGLVRRAGKALAGAISWVGDLLLGGEISEIFVFCADEPPMVKCDPGNLTVQCAVDEPIVRET